MFNRLRWSAASFVFVALLGLAAAGTSAQSPAQEKGAAPAKKKFDPSRRVPPFFARISLSGEQRESIYKIRRTHLDKIDELKRQIEQAEKAMLKECEGVLTETQKTQLDGLRRADASKPAPKPAVAAPAKKAG